MGGRGRREKETGRTGDRRKGTTDATDYIQAISSSTGTRAREENALNRGSDSNNPLPLAATFAERTATSTACSETIDEHTVPFPPLDCVSSFFPSSSFLCELMNHCRTRQRLKDSPVRRRRTQQPQRPALRPLSFRRSVALPASPSHSQPPSLVHSSTSCPVPHPFRHKRGY
jgi:hypothetical protein